MSRKRSNIKKIKRGARRWISILAVILVSVTVCGFIVSISDGGKDFFKPSEWTLREVNEDNLYQQADFKATGEDKVFLDGRVGVKASLTDDNTIKVNGEAQEDIDKVIATGTLKANTSYVFDSSLNDGTAGTIYMSIKVNGEEYGSYGGPVVIDASKITSDCQYSICLYIKKDHNVGRIELKPILCEGTSTKDVISFYA